jgi:hypothetical protein
MMIKSIFIILIVLVIIGMGSANPSNEVTQKIFLESKILWTSGGEPLDLNLTYPIVFNLPRSFLLPRTKELDLNHTNPIVFNSPSFKNDNLFRDDHFKRYNTVVQSAEGTRKSPHPVSPM